jgi:hypothetical protein
VRKQGVSHLGFPGAETPKPIYTLSSFRGFASRDFTMCADKGSRTLVSWEPKLRSPYIYTKLISGFRKSRFRDVRRQGVSHLGFPEPKLRSPYIYTKLILGFRKSGFRDVRGQGVSHLGFPGAETPKPIYTSRQGQGKLADLLQW